MRSRGRHRPAREGAGRPDGTRRNGSRESGARPTHERGGAIRRSQRDRALVTRLARLVGGLRLRVLHPLPRRSEPPGGPARWRRPPRRARLGLAAAGVATALMVLGLATPAAVAAPRPSGLEPLPASVRDGRVTLRIPARIPPGLLHVGDIVVVRTTGAAHRSLVRVTRLGTDHGRRVATAVSVPADALSAFRSAVTGTGRTLRTPVALRPRAAGGHVLPGATPVLPGATPADTDVECGITGTLTGALAFEPTAGGSISVVWVDVWMGIVWAPEISGTVWFDPHLSATLAAESLSGSCEVAWDTGSEELASIDTPAGPLSVCFGAAGSLGASVGVTFSQDLTATLAGRIGTNFRFGTVGTGLSPFNDVTTTGTATTPTASWNGEIWVSGGPSVEAEWGYCGIAGVGASATLTETLTLTGSPSGWAGTIQDSVNAAVNLDLLDWSFSRSVYNWNFIDDTFVSGTWPSGGSGGGGGGGGGGCGLHDLGIGARPGMIAC